MWWGLSPRPWRVLRLAWSLTLVLGTRREGTDMDDPAAVPVPDRMPLTRELIVRRALSLVDREGVAALSMRRLGSELGVEAMALYRHVNGREDLLEALIEEVTARLKTAAAFDLGPHGGWQSYLQWLANAVREVALEHPEVFPLITTRHPAAAWLRPPLRSLDVVEEFLTVLTDAGFSDEHATIAYRTFTSFLVGQLLLDITQRGASLAILETLDEGDAEVPNDSTSLEDFPHILRLRPQLSQDRSAEEFEIGLELILDRIEAMVAH